MSHLLLSRRVMAFLYSYDEINFRLKLSIKKWYFKWILFTQKQFLLCWHSHRGLSTRCGRPHRMPEPQKIIKYRKTICKKNRHLDRPAPLICIRSTSNVPTSYKRKLKSEKAKRWGREILSDTFSLLHKKEFIFLQSEWITNYIPEEKLIILFLQIYLVPQKV